MIRTALLVLGVIAGWISLTIAVAYAVPPRGSGSGLPDLADDPHWALRTPPNPPQYDRAPSIRVEVATTARADTQDREAQPGPLPRGPSPRAAGAASVRGAQPPAGVERWRSLVAQYPDWNVDTMLAIMRCESGGDPNARNASSGAAGLLQIYPARAGSFDPVTNIAQGHAKWVANGYQPWVSSRGCWG